MRRRELFLIAGAAIFLPRAGGAQQGAAMPLIGFLHGSAPVGQYKSYIASFVAGLGEEGYEPGRNVAVEYRWAEGECERVPALAAELLGLKPALIVAYGPPNLLRAAIDAIPHSLPIVFGTGGDPVAAGIVANLARPGGNATGVANRSNNLDTKRLELLRDLLPEVTTFGMILNPKNSDAADVIAAASEGARKLGRQLVVTGSSTSEQLDEAFASIVKAGAGALLMGSDTFLNAQSTRILALAERFRLPTMYNSRAYIQNGGLISYGADFADTYRLVGGYVGRILKGAKPSDLPVIEPTRYELLINLKTAKSLGLTVPPLILGRADEVIE